MRISEESMRVIIEDIGNGMININLGMRPDEIDKLVRDLQIMKGNPDQHFHISSNFDGTCRIGEFTFYNKESNEPDDIQLSGRAYAPGESIPKNFR
jgi:hypothetical protein